MTETSDQRRKRLNRERASRWLAKLGNVEKHRDSVRRCNQTPNGRIKRKARQAIYANRNREQERKRTEIWRKQNPEKAVQSHRIYYEKNFIQIRQKIQTFRLKNLETYRKYNRDYKARRRAGGGRLSVGYLDTLMKLQNSLCLVCRRNLSDSGYHLDHIKPISKGGFHCDTNVQLLCPSCNLRKSAKNFNDFLDEVGAAGNVRS